MSPEADALLDAIWAAPHDDTPRLVYADWLEEHGHPDYAHFIRFSCQLERVRGTLPPAEHARLRRERRRLAESIRRVQLRHYWHRPGVPDPHRYGIPDRSHRADADGFLRGWQGWWPFVWPRVLALDNATGREGAVARCEYLRRVEALTLHGTFLGIGYVGWSEREFWQPVAGRVLGDLAASPAVARLTALRVEPVAASAADLEAFASAPLAGRLADLRLQVQFAEGEYECLEAAGGLVRHEVARFLAEHGARLPHGEA